MRVLSSKCFPTMAGGAALLAALLAPTYIADPSAQSARTLPYIPGVSITERLLPSDTKVYVDRGPTHAGERDRPPTWQELADYAAEVSHFIAVVRITGVASELTEDGSWIRTRATADVLDMIKATTATLKKSRRVDITYEGGGRLEINGCVVEAGIQLHADKGRTYLFFGQRNEPADDLWLTAEVPLLVEGGRLHNPFRSEPHYQNDPLDGRSLEAVLAEIKKALK